MSILALTCTHGRKETVDIFLHHMNYPCVIVNSMYSKLEEQHISITSPDINGNTHHHLLHDNEPLGAKWNYGLKQCKNLDFEYILITGSDDIFSPGLIDYLAEKRVHYAGLLDFYFYDIERDLLKYCPGMRYSRKGEPHGAGRIIHRSVLEALDWVLWDDDLNAGLDASMTKRINTLDIDTYFCNIPDGMYAVDLKSGLNIHSLEEYNGIMLGQSEKNELRKHFNLSYA